MEFIKSINIPEAVDFDAFSEDLHVRIAFYSQKFNGFKHANISSEAGHSNATWETTIPWEVAEALVGERVLIDEHDFSI